MNDVSYYSHILDNRLRFSPPNINKKCIGLNEYEERRTLWDIFWSKSIHHRQDHLIMTFIDANPWFFQCTDLLCHQRCYQQSE